MVKFAGNRNQQQLSPRSVVPDTASAVPPPPSSPQCEELRKLQQENRQLRQELEDANYRIRELERTVALGIPGFFVESSSADSVEVQSVDLSVTSSASTVLTGSALANDKRKEQKIRDEQRETLLRQTKKIDRFKTKQSPPQASRIPYWNNPLVRSPSYERTITDLRALFRSDSEYSTTSSVDVALSSNSSSNPGFNNHNNIAPGEAKVSNYVSGYFLRSKSSDSETDNVLLAEI